MILNPLGPELEFLWDFIAFLITLFIQLLIININGAIQRSGKLSSGITRKLVHIFAAPAFLLTWFLYAGGIYSRLVQVMGLMLFVIIFLLVGTGRIKNQAFIDSMSRSGDPSELLKGTLYYTLILIPLSIFWYYAPVSGLTNASPLGFIVVGCLAGGDGLADILGRKYGGKREFGFRGATKTLAGCIAMFTGSFLFSYILIWIYSFEVAAFNMVALLIPIVFICFIATTVEALSPPTYDNVTVPVAVIIVGIIMSLTGMWVYPLWTL